MLFPAYIPFFMSSHFSSIQFSFAELPCVMMNDLDLVSPRSLQYSVASTNIAEDILSYSKINAIINMTLAINSDFAAPRSSLHVIVLLRHVWTPAF